jgi:purine-binding chemotaxis protein CheW
MRKEDVMQAVKEAEATCGQYLSFRVAGEEYAVGLLQVKEILEFDVATRVPTAPAWVLGVINLRGSVVPVIDLAVKFGLPETVVGPRTCVVIVEVALGGQSTVVGILADGVNQVVDLRPGDIQEPPPFGTHVRLEYLLGMGRAGKKFVLLLDIDRILSQDEILAASTAEPDVAATAAASAL